MNNSTSKMTTKRSSKFPLTLHPTGQYCKKIKGRLFYFGADKQQALERYLEQAAFLHSGKASRGLPEGGQVSLKMLGNLFLDHQKVRATSGEISPRHFSDQITLLKTFIRFIGPNRTVADISPLDLQNFRAKLIRDRKSPRTVNKHVTAFKALFHWALDNEIIASSPNLKAIKKIPVQREKKATFTPEQIKKLLQAAGPQMKAMIWLGLNCGFGCTDCAELLWQNVDLANGRVDFPRPKTHVDRNLPLWTETMEALSALPKKSEFVFTTRIGNPWVRVIEKEKKDGMHYTPDNALTKEFKKVMNKAKIEAPKGTGFYTLRRTAATLAAKFKDPFAIKNLLGHASLDMATVYVQDVSEQTDRVINGTRGLIVQDSLAPSEQLS